MVYIGNFFGFFAVALFVLSYQLKKRQAIIVCNTVSRLFYVIQYLFLGAFEGAIIDFIATLISALVVKKSGEGKRVRVTVAVLLYVGIIASSAVLYKNIFSLLSFLGVSLELFSLLFSKEKNIRIFSLAGQPCWLIYNAHFKAYSSVVGNVITIISIITALIRYDIIAKKENSLV